ncbi:Chorismate synthase [Methanoregula boonei 6A8]|uniref:Chorismate synthase n=1 Tax=Methanoregula boonei (strain DSM 21154 / JCM 14090 / 6A8) TaxID=456442 RepID=A7I8M0_METB6|nr:chorismate synthase [Methanoregula boonei]ABS56081.1 Chorismate synthase [Methanoregula boonei 6A8]
MNTFGSNFRITTFGESHGPAVGCVIDGCPPRLALSADDIQPLLDRRRPGTSPLSSARDEADTVEILSGVFEKMTTGTPIALLVRNQDMHSRDYDTIKEKFRPGHADFTYQAKYGIRDYRGGGRSSGRETVGRVAAGAVALKYLATKGIAVQGRIVAVHGKTDPQNIENEILGAKSAGDSVGGIAEITATGCSAGLGDPVFGKLDAGIAAAMMGIGAVKGVEIGDGFAVAERFGSENNDPMTAAGFQSNHAGGILGGISTGQDLVVRIAVKPTPSIAKVQHTRDIHGNATTITIGGRHDPCIVPRILPVAEAMLALVLIDAVLEQEKYR